MLCFSVAATTRGSTRPTQTFPVQSNPNTQAKTTSSPGNNPVSGKSPVTGNNPVTGKNPVTKKVVIPNANDLQNQQQQQGTISGKETYPSIFFQLDTHVIFFNKKKLQ